MTAENRPAPPDGDAPPVDDESAGPPRSRAGWIALPICGMGAVYFLSSQPGMQIKLLTPSADFDKVAHWIVYCVMVLLFVPWAKGHSPRRWIFYAVAAAFTFGLLDELHQLFTPDRRFEWLDLAANGLGTMTGAAIVWLHWTLFGKRRTLQGTIHDTELSA